MKRKVTERGQVTIPKEIRSRLGIRPGQEIEFTVEDGRLLLQPVTRRDPMDRLVGRIGEDVDVDAYLEETRGGRVRSTDRVRRVNRLPETRLP